MARKTRRRKPTSYTLRDPREGTPIPVEVRVDRRLKKSVRWEQYPDHIVLRIPPWLRRKEIPRLLEDIQAELKRKAEKAARRTHDDLAQRARYINRKYFDGRVKWEAIRWVSNMEKRLGSATLGGSTHGHIRISDKIRHWPQWVIDYVIAHELTHLLLPKEGHSPRFWATLRQAYPLTERARGFIKGYFFARQGHEEDMEDTL